MPSVGYGFDLCQLLGLGCGDAYGCGACGCDAGCGCEPTCGCGDCGCDVGCGREPSCGCSAGCGCDGRQFAGQTFNCCDGCGPPLSPCTGPECCGCETSCGCEPACGCGGVYGCGCDAGYGCEPSCGCGSGGCNSNSNCGFGQCCGRIVGFIDKLCGCGGCDSELYWSEWHNDPPRCCDPCDCHGNWIGPGDEYRAPYSHPYPADGYVEEGYYTRGKLMTPPATAARSSHPNSMQRAARPAYVGQQAKPVPTVRQSARPATRGGNQVPIRGQMTRRPVVGPANSFQR